MSAYLYYRRASPVLPDSYYDMLVRDLVRGWDRLDAMRKWQFGSADELAATGHHIKITMSAEGGAVSWHVKEKGIPPGGYWVETDEWRLNPRGSWTPAEPIGVERTKIKTHRTTVPKPEQLRLF